MRTEVRLFLCFLMGFRWAGRWIRRADGQRPVPRGNADVNPAARPQRALALQLRAVRTQVEHRDEASRPKRRPLDFQGRCRQPRLGATLPYRSPMPLTFISSSIPLWEERPDRFASVTASSRRLRAHILIRRSASISDLCSAARTCGSQCSIAQQSQSVEFFERIGCRRTLTAFVAEHPLRPVAASVSTIRHGVVAP